MRSLGRSASAELDLFVSDYYRTREKIVIGAPISYNAADRLRIRAFKCAIKKKKRLLHCNDTVS